MNRLKYICRVLKYVLLWYFRPISLYVGYRVADDSSKDGNIAGLEVKGFAVERIDFRNEEIGLNIEHEPYPFATEGSQYVLVIKESSQLIVNYAEGVFLYNICAVLGDWNNPDNWFGISDDNISARMTDLENEMEDIVKDILEHRFDTQVRVRMNIRNDE